MASESSHDGVQAVLVQEPSAPRARRGTATLVRPQPAADAASDLAPGVASDAGSDVEPASESKVRPGREPEALAESATELDAPAERAVPAQRPGPSTVESVPDESPAEVPVLIPAAAPPPGLSERDRAVLTFEKQYWKYSGAKEQAIRDRFGLSATRYYQVLNALLDNPAAQEFEPVVVKRLRRIRAARQRSRTGAGAPRPASA